MGVEIINIFLIVVAEFGRLWGNAKMPLILSSDAYLQICVDYQNRNTKRGLHGNNVFYILEWKAFL